MSLDVVIGRKIIQNKAIGVAKLPWEGNIGAFVVGRPGSGKSHVIASILTQYALKGVAVAIAEYNADPDNRESLIYRTRHIHHVLAYQLSTTGKEVEGMMLWLQDELKARQTKQKDKKPLVVVFDEFFAFSNTYKPKVATTSWKDGDITSDEGETRIIQKAPTYWEILISIQSDLRKNNIRLILAVQEPAASAGSTMRQVRDMFRFKLIMNLGIGGAKLLGIDDKYSQQLVSKLPPGFVFLRDIEDLVIGVPYPINAEWIELCKDTLEPTKIESFTAKINTLEDWTQEQLDMYFEALFRYAPRFDMLKIGNSDPIPAQINAKEDLIRLLILMGKGNDFIVKHIKGQDSLLRDIIAQYRAQYNKE
jgi:hypothetical protein